MCALLGEIRWESLKQQMGLKTSIKVKQLCLSRV